MKSYILSSFSCLNFTSFYKDSGNKKFKTLWPLFMDGVQLSQGYRASSKRPFLPLSPHEFLVLILSTLKG